MTLTHTEVDDRFEGKGVGSALARFALDDARADGTRRVLVAVPVHHHVDREAPGVRRGRSETPSEG